MAREFLWFYFHDIESDSYGLFTLLFSSSKTTTAMNAAWKFTPALWDKIHHFASFPQTGVSLQQMVLFGQHPSQGTLLKASQFLMEELPVRLAHRVKELDELPHNLSDMPSIKKVKNWYAQSFEVSLILWSAGACVGLCIRGSNDSQLAVRGFS